MFNVDIELKNGSILCDCSIFKEVVEENRIEMKYIDNEDEARSQFSKMPWGNEHRYVYFQNESMNGKVNVMQVRYYNFK
ncbi:hypothetical protein GRF59_14490 [Paenibacillus sp. HJL G12]|uniref:Uncharacterized protein n=1 Tax=Paenibacillus dendrobii TaxID=2691084 RepID=A0A7X3LGJ7_9BACL|nr:hypothetical protein [Paenibacillus dendrobii]MWV44826.1 hypothetical protein [Paenibacillus dendrobii]